jgi:type IV pilus assembly protein PilM
MLINRPHIAIDIGSSSVKILEITQGSQRKLKAIGLEMIPPGCIIDGEIKDAAKIQQAIQSLSRKLGINVTGRRTSLAISGSSALIKKIAAELPPNEQDVHEQLYLEAEQAFQHDMSDLYFRYKVLDRTLDDGKNLVLMVGAKSATVDAYCSLVKDIGMRVGVIDCETFCMTNMFDHNYQMADSVVVLLNIGASITQVNLVKGDDILYNREIYQGGNDYDKRIATELGVDEENAESLKLAASVSEDGSAKNIIKIISEVNESLVDEIDRTINFYYQSEDPTLLPERPKFVFVTGGGAKVPGIDTALASHLQLPVQILNPFRRIDVRSSGVDLGYIMSNGPLFGVAVGLGLRSMHDSK